MGLDMYLYKKTYVKNWDHMTPQQRHEIVVKRGGTVRDDIKPERISEIVEQVAYWRKANAIHKWFVANVQGGVDECQESYVDKEKLAELVSLCKQVLASVETVEGEVCTGIQWTPEGGEQRLTRRGEVIAQPGLAAKLLPTQSGFFFGSTDYDEGYLYDIKETIRQIEPLLAEEGGDFYYRASW